MLVDELNFISDSLKNRSNIKVLNNSITSGNISHAYLFSGNSIDFLTHLAYSFAASVNCEKKGCGKCRICENTRKGIFENMIVVEAEGPILTKDKITELQHFMSISSYSAGRKICIIKEAELMNDVSANSLLKILEEPPDQNSVFILLTEEPASILPTISSRCIIFDWDFIDPDGTKIFMDKAALYTILDEGIKSMLKSDSSYDIPLDLSISIIDFFREQLPNEDSFRKEQVSRLKDVGATSAEAKKFEVTLKSISKKKENKYYFLGINLVFDIITTWMKNII